MLERRQAQLKQQIATSLAKKKCVLNSATKIILNIAVSLNDNYVTMISI